MYTIRRVFSIAGDVYYSNDFSLAKDKQPTNQKKILSSMDQYSPAVKVPIENTDVKVFFYSDKTVYGEIHLPDDEGLKAYLVDPALPLNANYEVILENIDSAVKKVLEIIKYLFDFEAMDEHPCMLKNTLLWTCEGEQWLECADRRKYEWRYADGFFSIDGGTIPTIERLVKEQVEPFYGLRFLHKAKQESNLRDKWIYAATAAEMAIKQFLFIKDPSLKKQWNDKPAPPVEELYGAYLKKYAGQCCH